MAAEEHQLKITGPFVPASRTPTGGDYQPDQLADEIAAQGEPEEPLTDGGRMFRRLIATLGIAMLVAGINFFVLRRFELELPPYLLMTTFGVIGVAGVMAAIAGRGDEPKQGRPDACDSDGCAVGMCPGPRPPRFLRK